MNKPNTLRLEDRMLNGLSADGKAKLNKLFELINSFCEDSNNESKFKEYLSQVIELRDIICSFDSKVISDISNLGFFDIIISHLGKSCIQDEILSVLTLFIANCPDSHNEIIKEQTINLLSTVIMNEETKECTIINCIGLISEIISISEEYYTFIEKSEILDQIFDFYYYNIDEDLLDAIFKLFSISTSYESSKFLNIEHFQILVDFVHENYSLHSKYLLSLITNFVQNRRDAINEVEIENILPTLLETDVNGNEAILLDFLQKMSCSIDFCDLLFENGVIHILILLIEKKCNLHIILLVISNILSWKEENIIQIYSNEQIREFIFETQCNGSYNESLAASFCIIQLLRIGPVDIIIELVNLQNIDIIFDLISNGEVRLTILFLNSIIRISEILEKQQFLNLISENQLNELMVSAQTDDNEKVRSLAEIVQENVISRIF